MQLDLTGAGGRSDQALGERERPMTATIIRFPIFAKIDSAKRTAIEAYWAELRRIDELEYARKRAKSNRRIVHAYYAALGRGLPAYTATPDETAR